MIHKAVVLAAGRGTRMGALTEESSKLMLPIAGRPMLEHVVQRLQTAGLRDVLIVTGYRREQIEAHFGAGNPGLSLAVQDVPDGTASAVLKARGFAGEDSFLLTFGDIICSQENYSGICKALEQHEAQAIVGVKYSEDPWQGAAVYSDSTGRIDRIVEKPAKGTSTTHWNSAGLYAFTAGVFEEIGRTGRSERGEYEITTTIAGLIAGGRKILQHQMSGMWRDVGRPEDLAEMNRLFREEGADISG